MKDKPPLISLLRDTVIFGGGSYAASLLSVVLIPVYVRSFAVADLGRLELLLALAAASTALLTLGTDAAAGYYFNKHDDQSARARVIGAALLIRVGIAALMVMLALPFSSQIASALIDSPDSWRLIAVALLLIPATAVLRGVADAFRFQRRPKAFLAVTVANVAVAAGVTIPGILVFEAGILAPLLGALLGAVIGASIGIAKLQPIVPPQWQDMTRLIRYGYPLTGATIALLLTTYSDRFFVYGMLGAEDAGYYAVAIRFGGILGIVVTAFVTAWGPFAFATARDPQAGTVFRRSLQYYLAGTSSAILLGIAVTPMILPTITTPDYLVAAPAVGLIAFAASAQGVYYISSTGVWLAERTSLLTFTTAAGAVASPLIAVLMIPRYGFVGAALAAAAAQWLSAMVLFYVAQRVHPLPYDMRSLFVYPLTTVLGLVLLSTNASGTILAMVLKITSVLALQGALAAFLGVWRPRM